MAATGGMARRLAGGAFLATCFWAPPAQCLQLSADAGGPSGGDRAANLTATPATVVAALNAVRDPNWTGAAGRGPLQGSEKYKKDYPNDDKGVAAVPADEAGAAWKRAEGLQDQKTFARDFPHDSQPSAEAVAVASAEARKGVVNEVVAEQRVEAETAQQQAVVAHGMVDRAHAKHEEEVHELEEEKQEVDLAKSQLHAAQSREAELAAEVKAAETKEKEMEHQMHEAQHETAMAKSVVAQETKEVAEEKAEVEEAHKAVDRAKATEEWALEEKNETEQELEKTVEELKDVKQQLKGYAAGRGGSGARAAALSCTALAAAALAGFP